MQENKNHTYLTPLNSTCPLTVRVLFKFLPTSNHPPIPGQRKTWEINIHKGCFLGSIIFKHYSWNQNQLISDLRSATSSHVTWGNLFNFSECWLHHLWSEGNKSMCPPRQIGARIKCDSHSPPNPTSPDSLKFRAHFVTLSQDPLTPLKWWPETGCGPG